MKKEKFKGHTPTVTVVIPLYNHAKFIEKTLESIRAQITNISQIILIDDGSTDLGPKFAIEILEKIPNSIFIQNQNQGTARTLNHAISLATSDWIAVLNSDDLFTHNKIERCLSICSGNPGVEFIAGRVQLIDEMGFVIEDGIQSDWYTRSLRYFENDQNVAFSLISENYFVTTSNFFFSKSLWESLNGFADLRYCNDLEFALHAARNAQIYFDLEEVHVNYRIHSKNTISESIYAIRLERSVVLTFHILSMQQQIVSRFNKLAFYFQYRKRLKELRFICAFNELRKLYSKTMQFKEFQDKCEQRSASNRELLFLDF